MSNSALSLITSKNTNITSQTPPPSQAQSGSSLGAENYQQRRSGGSGSFGAGAASRATPFAARNNQSFRKQHKTQRRSRLTDEDAAAESVSQVFNKGGVNLMLITLIGGNAVYQQPKRANIDHSSHDLCLAPSSTTSPTFSLWS